MCASLLGVYLRICLLNMGVHEQVEDGTQHLHNLFGPVAGLQTRNPEMDYQGRVASLRARHRHLHRFRHLRLDGVHDLKHGPFVVAPQIR